MLGYKGTYKGKCLNIKYVPGNTYELVSGNLEICNHGFHFCENFTDIHKYYSFDKEDTVIFEVEAIGKIIEKEEKSVTDKIRIIREIPRDEYHKYSNDKMKFDKKGNLIYYENPYGYWAKKRYDKNNNLIYYESSNGYWEKYKFDKNNNLIYYENSKKDLEAIKCDYDKDNNLISIERGDEKILTYASC